MKYVYALGSVSQPLHFKILPGCPPPESFPARGVESPKGIFSPN